MGNHIKNRTVHQIVDKTGQPYQANVTSNVWVTQGNVFAAPTENNKVVPFTTGEEYFADLITACRAAQSEICIAGWQINWDALLAPNVRLYDLLYEVVSANKALKVYVMPWSHSLPVETYDRQTAIILEKINIQLKTLQIEVISSPSYADADERYFSHHQKQVVIDRKIVFMGGMDIAYGRYDDNYYDLHAESKGRHGMNRYNGCIEPVGKMDGQSLVDPDLLEGAVDWLRGNQAEEGEKLLTANHWQVKYAEAGVFDTVNNSKGLAADKADLSTLDEGRQPRMPWQDVHCRIEGPAVSDLLRNFVLRWNILAKGNKNIQRLTMPDSPKSYPAMGKTHVQVLRSAPAKQCKKEQENLTPKPTQPAAPIKQDNIHQAMLALIEKSRRFIYIENQFFVSGFGKEAKRSDGLSSAAKFIDTFYGDQQNSSAQKMAWNNSRKKVQVKQLVVV